MSIHRLKIVSYLKDLWTRESRNFASKKIIFFYIFFGELVVLFAFQGLNSHCFWDDEAETAIIAKNLLVTGHLTGWDGRHLCTYRDGNLLDGNFRPKNPLGMYLATAASFRAFGCSTFAGRFPFVIFGVGALCILFWMLRADYPSLPAFVRYGVALTALSTSYLLYIRQCRYYSLCIFFSLLALAFHRASLRNPRWAVLAGLGASLTALFFSHYLIMVCFSVRIVCRPPRLSCPPVDKKRLFPRRTGAALCFLLPVAWFSLLFRVWIRPDLSRGTGTPAQILTRLYLNFRDFDVFGVLPGILAVGGVA